MGLVLVPAPAARADTYAPISGAGSTWSQVAVDAWRADIRASGVVVNFAGTGSTDGRSQFIQATVDFANTEIPFQNPPEPGQQAETPSRPFAYLPIVAGGTSFMYNLTVGGQRVRDLRLSAATLSKIFTGAITRWSDPAIAADYGKALPDIPIIPVVRSDGAGASAQFTKYMASQAPTIYCPFIQDKLHLSSRLPERVLLPGVRQLQGAGRLQRRRQLRLRVVRRRRDRLRRVRLCQADQLPGHRAAQQGRLLRAADRGQRRGGADQGGHQPRPDPEPRVGLRQPGPAGLPDVELQLHGHPDDDGRAVQHRQGQDALDVHQLLPLPGPAEGRHPRLLAAAEEPGAGRLRPGQTDPGRGGVALDRDLQQPGARHPQLRAPARPLHQAGGDRVRHERDHQRCRRLQQRRQGRRHRLGWRRDPAGATAGASTDATGTYRLGGCRRPAGRGRGPGGGRPARRGRGRGPDRGGQQRRRGGGRGARSRWSQLAGGRDGQGSAVAWIGVIVLALTVLTPPFLLQRHRRRR